MKKLVKNEGQFDSFAQKELSIIREIMPDAHIEHIGSTAIPGAETSGVIDIMVGLDKALEIVKYFNGLDAAGYSTKDDAHLAGRKFLVKTTDEYKVHLSIIKYNSEMWKNYITIRDYLRQNEEDLARYNLLKLQCLETCPEDYLKQRSEFKLSILHKIDRLTNRIERKNLTHDTLEELSKKYKVPMHDLYFIYLNISGLNTTIDFPRLRMRVQLVGSDEVFYFGLANRPQSPFRLVDKQIWFEDRHIADVVFIENDDCASSYFRKNKTVITLNSNRRSTCTGCKFCPNNLELNSDDLNLDTEEKLVKHFEMLMEQVDKKDLSFLERITVCTGCFNSESKAVDHMILVSETAKKMGFDGVIHYIGSEIKTTEAMQRIKENIKTFMITFTVECFTNRYLILRGTKASLTLDVYKKLMCKAREHGFIVNYIYILGLDNLEDVLKNIEELKDFVSYFPSVNVFQPHVADHDDLVSSDAYCNLEYYLIVRKKFEDLYNGTGIKPHSWECYRPLWYYYYDGKFSEEIRI